LEWFELTAEEVIEVISYVESTVVDGVWTGETVTDYLKTDVAPKDVPETFHPDLSEITDEKSEDFIEAVTSHGLTGTFMYAQWQAMKGKARDKGVPVCDEWKNNAVRFIEDMEDDYKAMGGDRPALMLIDEMIGYSKDNCEVVSLGEASKSTIKDVVQFTLDGNPVAVFESAAEASRLARSYTGEKILAAKIGAVCRGERKTHAGYIWMFGTVDYVVDDWYDRECAIHKIREESKLKSTATPPRAISREKAIQIMI